MANRWIRGAALVIAFLAISAAVLRPAALRSPEFSPFDEQTHAGYAWSVSHGELPAAGSYIPDPILVELACAGQFNSVLPPCGPVTDPAAYSFGGYQHNYWQPPLYYALTGPVAALVSDVAGTTFVGAMRALSIVWISLGMAVLYLALRRLDVRAVIAFASCAVIPAMPWVHHIGTTASNDAVSVLGAALATLVAAEVIHHHRSHVWWWAGLATFGLALTKTLNALPLLLLASVLLLLALRDRRGTSAWPVLYLTTAGSILVGFLLAYLPWSVIQARRGDPDWVSPVDGVADKPFAGLPFDEWSPTLLTGLNPTAGAWIDPGLGVQVGFWFAVAAIFVTVAPWLGFVALRGDRARRAVAATLVLGVLTFPLVVQVQILAATGVSGYYPYVTTRYGASLIPLACATWALVADRFRYTAATVLFCIGGLTATALAAW